jgi:hypothetical protein
VTAAPAARRFSTSTADVELPSGPWGDLDANQAHVVRTLMARTPAGLTVLRAIDQKAIFLTFTNADSPRGGQGGTNGNRSCVYLQITQHGDCYTANIETRFASPAEFAAAVAIHEGIHALGLAGSKRAEWYCRLQEMKFMGFDTSNRDIQREVHALVFGHKAYAHLPDTNGSTSAYFPGVTC